MSHTLAALCELLTRHGFAPTLEGDPNREIDSVATLEDAGPRQISFLSNPKYLGHLKTTTAGAVVLKPDVEAPETLNCVRVADPYAAITALIILLHGYRKHRELPESGDKPQIHPTAKVGANAKIHPGATIDEEVVIGDNAVIYPGCYVGPRTRIGDDVLLYPNVVIYDDTIVGDRVTIHANSVIGNDGLGYAPYNDKWLKIPQIGRVRIADDVEIGASCAIDRATLGETKIGAGTKFSNLIAVGHGTAIGEHCLLVAQTGLAGSVTVGNHVTMAGQVGVVGHIAIGDHVTVGAKAGVINNIPAGETVLGQPAVPINEAKRRVAYVSKLPDMAKKLKDMEKQVRALVAEIERLKAERAEA